MRQLKFRVWSKKLNRYVIQDCDICDWSHGIGDLPDDSEGTSMYENYVVEQYTGLKDGTHADVYVGDIIQSYNYPNICVVEDTIHGYGTYLPKHTTYDFDNNSHEHPPIFKHLVEFKTPFHDYKIIGNINENPELVENMK